MPPQGIDMDLVKSAINWRAQQKSSGVPMGEQLSAPMGTTPTGGANTPAMPPATTPVPEGQQPGIPAPSGGVTSEQAQGAVKEGQRIEGTPLDDQTKTMMKAVIQRFLKFI